MRSEAWQVGRCLTLNFVGEDYPELERIEFRYEESVSPTFWQRGDSVRSSSLVWTKVPQALALIFMDYCLWAMSHSSERERFFFRGNRKCSPAASLGDAIQRQGNIHDLFSVSNGGASCVARVFNGENMHGKMPRERKISINLTFLPPDCVQLFWEKRRIDKPDHVELLATQIRKSLGLSLEKSSPIVVACDKPKQTKRLPKSSGVADRIANMPPEELLRTYARFEHYQHLGECLDYNPSIKVGKSDLPLSGWNYADADIHCQKALDRWIRSKKTSSEIVRKLIKAATPLWGSLRSYREILREISEHLELSNQNCKTLAAFEQMIFGSVWNNLFKTIDNYSALASFNLIKLFPGFPFLNHNFRKTIPCVAIIAVIRQKAMCQSKRSVSKK